MDIDVTININFQQTCISCILEKGVISMDIDVTININFQHTVRYHNFKKEVIIMKITVNNKPYDRDTVHAFFKSARKEVHDRNITDEHGYIDKTLTCTELFTHAIGNLQELNDYIKYN